MSLLIWLPLSGDIKNYGTSEYVTTQIGTLSSVAGKIGPAYRFDTGGGTGNGISLNTNLVGKLGNYFSIACWVNPYGNHVHYNGTIFSSGNWNSYCWAFGLSQDNTRVDLFGNWYNQYIDCTVPTNIWTHLVCVNNNGICSVYKNGVLVGTGSDAAAINSDASNCCVGRETYAGGYFGFNGAIQDLRIYDHCLSVEEIKEISQALVLHYPLRDTGIESTVNYSNDLWASYQSYYTIQSQTNTSIVVKRTSTSTTSQVALYTMNVVNNMNPGEVWTLSCYLYKNGAPWKTSATRASAYLTSVISYEARNDGYFTVTFNVPANDYQWVIHEALFGGTTTDDICEFRYLQLEKKNHATPFVIGTRTGLIAYDCSGYNRNGTVTASTCPIPVSGSARNSICYQFDGTDDLITTSFTQNDILPDKKFTISAWVNLTEWKNYRGVFGPHDTGGNIRGVFFCQCDEHEIHFGFGNGSSWLRVRDSGYTLGTWAHYVMTYDGTKEIVYRNGTKVGEASGSIVFDTGTITLGRAHINSGSINRYWKGMISDFRIYATALSADDIARLYKTSASIDKNKRLHCYELENDRDNIFTSENVQEYATSSTGAYGQWTTRNSVPAMTIEPNRFYHADSRDQEVLKDYFVPDTSYKFDMWIDSDDVVYNNNNVPGGFIIYYTDGSSDSTFVVGGNHSSPIGFQHRTLITPSSKSIKGIGIYYYTSTPVFYRAGSSIVPISSTSIKKNGVFKDGYTVELDDTISINKGGTSYVDSIVEF